ncbi:MAG: DUF805 domain-containing protein [Deltaproteobacteria bacterium]|jgi:uncharacterized membrane protein YhaH (DUF805 family)|nr:DUF805 domain-containing protein [Deltaproteobacteria bacterium]
MGTVTEAFVKNCANFKGRANRREYWHFICVYFSIFCILLAIASVCAHFSKINPFYFMMLPFLFALFALVPSIAVTIRRIHDFDVSGWLILLALLPVANYGILIAFGCIPGTPGPNRFGRPPDGAPGPPGKPIP